MLEQSKAITSTPELQKLENVCEQLICEIGDAKTYANICASKTTTSDPSPNTTSVKKSLQTPSASKDKLIHSEKPIADTKDGFLDVQTLKHVEEFLCSELRKGTFKQKDGHHVLHLGRQYLNKGKKTNNDNPEHNYFNLEEKISFVSENLESIFVRITNTTEPLLVGSIYRPPNGDIDKFHKEIEKIFTETSKNLSYIMGDYNIDLFKNNLATRTFENTIYSNGFAPLILTTTHKKPGCSNSRIDNIISNNISQIVYTGSICEKLLHHFPIFQLTEFPKDAQSVRT